MKYIHKNIIIVLALFTAVVIGLSGGYIIWGRQTQGPNPNQPFTESPFAEYSIEDSFIIPPYNEIEFEGEYTTWPPTTLYPFFDKGLYISTPFYVADSQVIDIVILSDLPVVGFEKTLDSESEYLGGLVANLWIFKDNALVSPPYGSFQSFSIKKSGDLWVSKAVFNIQQASGPYHLMLHSESGQLRYLSDDTDTSNLDSRAHYKIFVSQANN